MSLHINYSVYLGIYLSIDRFIYLLRAHNEVRHTDCMNTSRLSIDYDHDLYQEKHNLLNMHMFTIFVTGRNMVKLSSLFVLLLLPFFIINSP